MPVGTKIMMQIGMSSHILIYERRSEEFTRVMLDYHWNIRHVNVGYLDDFGCSQCTRS